MDENSIQVNGKEQLMEMFEAADEDLKHSILQGIEKRNPNLYKILRQSYIKFEDLVLLDMKDFQALLRQIPKKRLFLCLRMASIAFRKKVYQCVSDRQIEEIENYLQLGSKEPVFIVKREQEEVVNLVKKLKNSGFLKINTTRKDIWI